MSAELCAETFGSPDDPAILLVAGAAQSMDRWEEAFCRRLAYGGRFVIRYDHRDTGQSTAYAPGAPGYAFADLVTDPLGLLDRLGVRRAHVAGASMGGGIGQLLALDHAERVASLTLLSTSPGIRPAAPPREDLPPMAATLRARYTGPPEHPDWTDRAAVIEHIVAGELPLTGSRGLDATGLRRVATRVVDRTCDIAASMINHGRVDPGEPYGSRLGRITAPTLVIHGTEDPLFPYGHAEALAREIPGARLLPLDGVGHEMPPPWTWGAVVSVMLGHTG